MMDGTITSTQMDWQWGTQETSTETGTLTHFRFPCNELSCD